LRDRNRRLDLEVGVAYGSDVAQVLQLLERATRETQGVSNDPAPTVFFSGLAASALNFSVRAWTREFDDGASIRSQLLARIYADLQAARIEIPFPQQDVHVRSLSAELVAALKAAPTQTGARQPDPPEGASPTPG
jgi:small-conductance mechanosensitive channel